MIRPLNKKRMHRKSKELLWKTISTSGGKLGRVKEEAAMDKSQALRLANRLPVAIGARKHMNQFTRWHRSHETPRENARDQKSM